MDRDAQFQIVMKDLSHLSKVYLVPLADFHQGCRDADEEVSGGYIQWIAQHDDAYTLLNGDMMNCATKDSSPELYNDLITPDAAYLKLRARLEPIKDKILMITRGTHEEMVYRKVGVDFMARLAYDLGDIPYRPYGGMLGLKMSLNNKPHYFFIYATHGWGAARKIGAKVQKVEDLVLAADVDCYILSHDHTQVIHRLNIPRPPRGGQIRMNKPIYMETDRKLLVNTGGFIRYSGYIRQKGYTPQDLGTPRIRLEIKSRQVNGKTHYYKDLHASI